MKKRLSPKQQVYLERRGYKGGPTIGDMIEFLGDRWWHELTNSGYYNSLREKFIFIVKNEELCDALFEAVKGVLEK